MKRTDVEDVFITVVLPLISLLLILCFGLAYENSSVDSVNTNTQEYEVLSVYKYSRQITNNLGGVVRTDVCFSFDYIDEDGNVVTVDGFQNLEHGLTKVHLGNRNKYIVYEKGIDTYRDLYLTKDTFRELTKGGLK